MGPLVIATVAIAGTGLVCGCVLAAAARIFRVDEDPRIARLTDLLPGYNCGGCSFGGGPGGPDTARKVSGFMGVESEAGVKHVALVLCNGDLSRAPRRFRYNGVADCAAAHAVGGGDKGCRYGCLGYGSCARVCPSGAIEITAGMLAVVHPERCIGCRACVRACPRGIIRMVPEDRFIHVLCRSKDKGPEVKKVCQVGCIACRLCVKLADEGAIAMDGSLAVVDYSKPLTNTAVVEKCPGHCIVNRPLKEPSAAQAAA
jgi:electron transport complex protein RnfB